MSCAQCQGIQTMFAEDTARRELKRYRRKGPAKTTRLLLDALEAEGVQAATLLDIGGGVGAISNALLDAGARSATVVDASPAYIAAAKTEAARRGHGDRIAYREGDFVDVAPDIAPADVVTLDRVICCYDDMEALVSASAGRAGRLYGVVYPRVTWWNRIGFPAINLTCRIRRSPFRVFLHEPEAVEAVVRGQGLTRRSYTTTLLWQIVVYGRA